MEYRDLTAIILIPIQSLVTNQATPKRHRPTALHRPDQQNQQGNDYSNGSLGQEFMPDPVGGSGTPFDAPTPSSKILKEMEKRME